MTPFEQGFYASGTRRFEKIIRFATIECVKAGWLLKSKGVWSVTDAGKNAMLAYPDPEKFYRQAMHLYSAWKKSSVHLESEQESEPLSAAETAAAEASVTFEQAEEQAWNEIEAHLGSMPPYEVQDLVAGLLKALGYHIAWISPPGKDGGVDIIAHVDPLGTQAPRIKVQVKRTAQKIDLQTLNSFLAIIDEDDVGLFVSTGGFTKDAEDTARKQTSRKITLIDLERLIDLWVSAYSKLDEKSRRKLPLSPIYFLTPEE
jgi:restriction system protein